MNPHASQCTGKTAWKSWSDADRQARKMRRKHRLPIQPYRCELCHRFHVGESSDGIFEKENHWG